jgi:hypothetical protein
VPPPLRPAEPPERALGDRLDVLGRHLVEQRRLDRGWCQGIDEDAGPGEFLPSALVSTITPALAALEAAFGVPSLPAKEAIS